MGWNLILTLEEKPDGGGELIAGEPAEEGRGEQNEFKSNRASEAEEFRTALRLLLREGATQLAELKEEMSAKLPHEVLLMVDALKKSKLTKVQKSYVELLETNTRKLTEPFARRISNPLYKLSPKEVKVACLIKDGLTNKEIAKLLKVSKSTILTHRHHVRTKLGLKNKKQNLQSYLNSFGTQQSSK
jgi:DNA-binding CsgD family transcriptional regulator